MKTKIIFLIATLCTISCNKQDNIVENIKIIWSEKLHLDNTTSSTIEPQLVNNGVLFSSNPYDGDYRGYFLLDRKTGKQLWHWKDNIKDFEQHEGKSNIAFNGESIIINNGKERYCIDANTGNTNWKERDEFNYGIHVIMHDNKLYAGREKGDDYGLGSLVSYTFIDPTPTVLYQNPTDSSNMREYNYPPAFSEQNGDTWMVFSDGFVNYDNAKGHPWLVCYNLTADSLIWRKQVSEAWFHAGIEVPTIHNNRIYMAESFHIVCLNLFTGEEIWRKTYGNSVSYTPIALFEGKLFVSCEDEYIDILDLENGNRLHRENGTGGTASRLRYHKGRIYYVSGGDGLLHCINASTGKHLWTMEGPKYKNDRDLFFDSAGIAIDPDTDYLYITDYRYAYCFEILD